MRDKVDHAGGPFEAEQLESRILLSTSDFGGSMSLDAEINRQGVTVVRAAVADAGECDSFAFTARETGKQRLVLRDLNDSGLNGVLTVFDGDGNIVRQKDATGPGGREIAQFNASLGDVFRIQVGGNTGGDTGDYRLRVKTQPGPVPASLRDAAQRIDSLFDNGDGTTALLESSIAGQAHSRAFAFTARDNGQAGIITRTSAASFTTTLDARMIVADSAGNLLRIKNKRAGGEREEARIDVVQGQRYFILISGVWGDDVEGDFRLRVRAPAGDPPLLEIGGIQTADAQPLDLIQTPSGLRAIASDGLEMTVFDLSQDAPTQLPDFDSLTPDSRGNARQINFLESPGDNFGIGLTANFALVFEGMINIAQNGPWRFSTESADGSRLFIDDQLVVDNDGVHAMTTAFGDIALAAGVHDIRLEYFNASGPSGLILNAAPPSQFFRPVSPSDLSNDTLIHDPVAGNMLYRLTPAMPGDLQLRLVTLEQTNAVLGLYDADGNPITESDLQGRAQTETLSHTVGANQTLFVLTSENTGTPNIEGQSLDAIAEIILDAETTGSALVALNPGQPDSIKFTSRESGTYTISIEAGFVGRVTFYDDTGFELSRQINPDADGGPDQLTIELASAQTIVVAFDAALGDGLAGETTLRVHGPTGSIDGISIADAIDLTRGQPFDGSISQPGDRVLFTATAGFILTTFALQTNAGLDGTMSIYEEDGTLIALINVGVDSFEDFVIVRLQGFRFFIVVDGGSTTGDFQFTVT